MNIINKLCGQVTIITTPYHSQPRAWRKGWEKKLRIGRLYFYISNCRMKKRPIRDMMYANNVQDHCVKNKRKLYERQGGRCPHCGQPFEYEAMELHHVLPLARFPNLDSLSATVSCFATSATRRCIATRGATSN